MPTSTLTSKGQITLPKAIREYLHAKPGTKIDFIIQENGEIVMKAVNRSVGDLEGILAPYIVSSQPGVISGKARRISPTA